MRKFAHVVSKKVCTHRVDIVVNLSVEKGERIAALPALEVLLKIADHEMACDGRDSEIDPSGRRWESVGEVVVLDPLWSPRVALSSAKPSVSLRTESDSKCTSALY